MPRIAAVDFATLEVRAIAAALPPGGHLHQPPNSKLCGPICVAMVANVSAVEALRACGGRKNGTHGVHLVQALNRLRVPNGGRSVLIRQGTDIRGLHGIVRFRNAKARPRWGGHWVVVWKGIPFDPEYGTEPATLCGMPAGAHPTSYIPIERRA